MGDIHPLPVTVWDPRGVRSPLASKKPRRNEGFMKDLLQTICQKLQINKENAGLWLQLVLCIGAIFLICRKSLFSVSSGKPSSRKKA